MIVDDNTLDIPAFKRRAEEHRGHDLRGQDHRGPTRLAQGDAIESDDKLDIPAFLRKQID